MYIFKFLCEPMHFLFPTSWYRYSIVISSTNRISKFIVAANFISYYFFDSIPSSWTSLLFARKQKDSQTWKSNNAACKMTGNLDDSSFQWNDLLLVLSWLRCLVAGLRLDLRAVDVHFINTGLSTITLIRHVNYYLTNDCVFAFVFL